jgi:hypothetical protein
MSETDLHREVERLRDAVRDLARVVSLQAGILETLHERVKLLEESA